MPYWQRWASVSQFAVPEPQQKTNRAEVSSGGKAAAYIRASNENVPPGATAYITTSPERIQEQMDDFQRRLEEVERKQK